VAVACGVLESVVNAVTSPDYDVAVQLSVRTVVYLLVTLLIVRLKKMEPAEQFSVKSGVRNL